MNIYRFFFFSIAVFISYMFSTDIHAYRYRQCGDKTIKWKSAPTFYFINISFPIGSSYRNIVEKEIEKIKQIGAGSTVSGIRTSTDYSSTTRLGDGRSKIYFTIFSGERSESLGYTKWRHSSCYWYRKYGFFGPKIYAHSYITEADISFPSNNFHGLMTTDSFRGASDESNFGNVVLHEMGHSLGMIGKDSMKGHELRWPLETMRDASPSNEVGNWNDGVFWAYPSHDYRAFLRYAYGSGEQFYDFSVSPRRVDYSIPSLSSATRVMQDYRSEANGSGVSNSYTRDSNTCEYYLHRNRLYYLEVTILNQGSNKNHQGVQGKVYLSTNDYISSSDRPVSNAHSYWPTSGWPYTYKVPFSISSSLFSLGTVWYIGYVIDYNNRYQEKYEGRTNGGANLCRVRITG